FTRSGHTQLLGNSIMITSTISIVLFSTMVFGFITKPLISFLLPPQKQLSAPSESELSSTKPLWVPLLPNGQDAQPEINGHDVNRVGSLRMLLRTPSHTVHYYWRKFDDSYMRPVFGGRGFVPGVQSSPAEEVLQ
ncbi:hypothetical protein CRG98_020206, partial [Punica granatum]